MRDEQHTHCNALQHTATHCNSECVAHLSFHLRMLQKRPRELDYRLRFEIEEMTIKLQWAVLVDFRCDVLGFVVTCGCSLLVLDCCDQ